MAFIKARYFRPAAVLAGVIGLSGAAIALYWFDPTGSSFFPRCPLHALTGIHCPGCGGLRAVHALLHLQLFDALAWNPLLVLLLPLGGWHFASLILRPNPLPAKRADAKVARRWLILLVGFAIVRNLPWYPCSLLAPHANHRVEANEVASAPSGEPREGRRPNLETAAVDAIETAKIDDGPR